MNFTTKQLLNYIKGQKWGNEFLKCYYSILNNEIKKGINKNVFYYLSEELLSNFLMLINTFKNIKISALARQAKELTF